MGCYNDRHHPRAISGDVAFVDNAENAVEECYERANGLGHKLFAVQKGNECFTSGDAGEAYWKYGRANGCKHGRGGTWMLNVYKIGKS